MFPTPEIYLQAELAYRKETVSQARGRAGPAPRPGAASASTGPASAAIGSRHDPRL